MDLYYRKYGQGPPLIILHGLYGDSSNWVTIARKLEKSFTVYLPDMRNHGNSFHSQKHDYLAMSSDIARFTEMISADRVSFLGHSMGGKAAMTFALQNPERVAALIVADISPFSRSGLQDSIPRFHRKVLDTIIYTDISSYTARSQVEKAVSEKIGDAGTTSFLLKNLQRGDDGRFRWKLNARALSDNLGLLMGSVQADTGSPVTGFPVLFIRGGDSGYLPESHFPEIGRLFPAAEFKTLEGTGHWLHAEKPDEFTEIVKLFLGGAY